MTTPVGRRGWRVVNLGEAGMSDGRVGLHRWRMLVCSRRDWFGLSHVFCPSFLCRVRSVF
jgi:hypothetical protein